MNLLLFFNGMWLKGYSDPDSIIGKDEYVSEPNNLQLILFGFSVVVYISVAAVFLSMIPATLIAGNIISDTLVSCVLVFSVPQLIFALCKFCVDKEHNVGSAYLFLGAILTIPGGIPFSWMLYKTGHVAFGIFAGCLWLLSSLGVCLMGMQNRSAKTTTK